MATLMVVPSWFGNDPTAIRLLAKKADKYNKMSKELFDPYSKRFVAAWAAFLMLEEIKTDAGDYVNRTRADHIAMKNRLREKSVAALEDDALAMKGVQVRTSLSEKHPYAWTTEITLNGIVPDTLETIDASFVPVPIETVHKVPLNTVFVRPTDISFSLPRAMGKGAFVKGTLTYYKTFTDLLKAGQGLLVLEPETKVLQLLIHESGSKEDFMGKSTKIITTNDLGNLHPVDITRFKDSSKEILKELI